MNKAKCTKELYCDFLIAAQTNFTCTQSAELSCGTLAHDAVNRWLCNRKMTPSILWEHTQPLVDRTSGYLIIDDTVLDKPWGFDIGLTKWQYSGTHHRVVHGIGLETVLWTDGTTHMPVDYRIYAKQEDGYTKNQHFQAMVINAHHRGFHPKAVLIDAWYTTVANLKMLDSLQWDWLAELQSNRLISLKPHEHQRLDTLTIPTAGLKVHLKNYGTIKVFKSTAPNGRVGYFATSDLNQSTADVEQVYATRWQIEEYHRGLKQTTGIDQCQARKQRIQRNHIFCSILAFVALEVRRIETDVSWYQSKREIIEQALVTYLKQPFIELPALASA